MAAYKEIQRFVKNRFGKIPKSCWIAHCKELNGLLVRRAYNRQDSNARLVLCNDPNMKAAIREAFEHFGMIQNQTNSTS